MSRPVGLMLATRDGMTLSRVPILMRTLISGDLCRITSRSSFSSISSYLIRFLLI